LQARRWLEYLKAAIEAKRGYEPAIIAQASPVSDVATSPATPEVESPATTFVDLQQRKFHHGGKTYQFGGDLPCQLLAIFLEQPGEWFSLERINARSTDRGFEFHQGSDIDSPTNQIRRTLGRNTIEGSKRNGRRLRLEMIGKEIPRQRKLKQKQH